MRTDQRGRIRGVALAVGLASVMSALAACGGAPSQELVASVSADPGPEPSPSIGPPVTEPAKPAAWSDTGAGGAEAAAVWYLVDEYRYIIETNDIAEWQRLSHPECEFCSNVIMDARGMIENNRTSRQDGPNRVTVTRVEELNPLAYSVLVDIDQARIDDYDASGDVVHESEGGPAQILLVLHREGPDWQLRAGQGFSVDATVPSALGSR